LFESTATRERIFAINVHQSSKGGSSPIHGDPRPPINGVLDARITQANVTANFISTILAADPAARVIVGGDFNEFTFTKPAFAPYFANNMLEDADIVVNIDPVERYTYQYDMNAQQLDHILVSNEVAKTLEYEHIHVNTWAESYEARVSDHDPSVGRLKLCGKKPGGDCWYKVQDWCAAPLPSFNTFETCL
jgi:predicted extracellular nuclease